MFESVSVFSCQLIKELVQIANLSVNIFLIVFERRNQLLLNSVYNDEHVEPFLLRQVSCKVVQVQVFASTGILEALNQELVKQSLVALISLLNNNLEYFLLLEMHSQKVRSLKLIGLQSAGIQVLVDS